MGFLGFNGAYASLASATAFILGLSLVIQRIWLAADESSAPSAAQDQAQPAQVKSDQATQKTAGAAELKALRIELDRLCEVSR